LAGDATSIIFVAANTCLSLQKFVATNACLSRQITSFVATKIILVVAPASGSHGLPLTNKPHGFCEHKAAMNHQDSDCSVFTMSCTLQPLIHLSSQSVRFLSDFGDGHMREVPLYCNCPLSKEIKITSLKFSCANKSFRHQRQVKPHKP